MLFFVYTGWFVKAIDFIIPGQITAKNIMFHIAIAHSAFNVVNTLVFLPFTGLLEKVSILFVPKREGAVEMGAKFLEKHLLDTPPIAMEQARKETGRMLSLAGESVSGAAQGFLSKDIKALKPVSNLEQVVDNLQSEIIQYLVELSEREIPEEDSQELPVLIHSVNDIERIGDHAENISELAERRIAERLPFSEEAVRDLNSMWKELEEMMKETEEALRTNGVEIAEKVLRREENINQFQKNLKDSHVRRLNNGQCNLKSGIVFMDFVDNLEKIGDHLTNIAEGVIGGMRWQGLKEAEVEVEDGKYA